MLAPAGRKILLDVACATLACGPAIDLVVVMLEDAALEELELSDDVLDELVEEVVELEVGTAAMTAVGVVDDRAESVEVSAGSTETEGVASAPPK